MIFNRAKQNGIGLIEVLVSLVVLAAGLLSVATLHLNVIELSSDNKSRAEAMTMAQQRLEELRNYSADVASKAEFDLAYADISNGNSTSGTGINTSFTRTESITESAGTKDLSVSVTWSDAQGDSQTVVLNSSVGWQSPRAVGDVVGDSFDSLVPSATGRARLGAGKIADYSHAVRVRQDTGLMSIYESGTGEYLLVDNDSDGTVVLTLLDACDLSGATAVCTDFVKISGRVYIDTTTHRSLAAGNVYVKASDAAYCQLYYIDGSGDEHEVLPGSSSTNNTTSNGDYNYYDYTCYLGGGWHGNIGIILQGGISQSDKVCQGDPVSGDVWRHPEIAARRVYRGMTHIPVMVNGAPVDKTYFSIGVADALELPAAGAAGHDFVISSLNVNATTGDNCISAGVMVRTDSIVNGVPGALFEGVPTDFFCLNENSGFVDRFNTAIYTLDPNCPFDPSDPPSQRHVITGTILVNSSLNVDSTVAAMDVNTSDGLGNCTVASYTKPTASQYAVTYNCDVYDWGTGWQGYIQLNTDYSVMACTPFRESFTAVTSASTATGHDCVTGSILTVTGSVTGSVTNNSNKKLSNAETTDSSGLCSVASDGLSYSCFTDVLGFGTTWTGILSFTSDNGSTLCIYDPTLSSGSFSISDGTGTSASIYLQNVDPGTLALNLVVLGNNNTCP